MAKTNGKIGIKKYDWVDHNNYGRCFVNSVSVDGTELVLCEQETKKLHVASTSEVILYRKGRVAKNYKTMCGPWSNEDDKSCWDESKKSGFFIVPWSWLCVTTPHQRALLGLLINWRFYVDRKHHNILIDECGWFYCNADMISRIDPCLSVQVQKRVFGELEKLGFVTRGVKCVRGGKRTPTNPDGFKSHRMIRVHFDKINSVIKAKKTRKVQDPPEEEDQCVEVEVERKDTLQKSNSSPIHDCKNVNDAREIWEGMQQMYVDLETEDSHWDGVY